MVEVENKIQRYESYQDSGVAWLGEIPKHWELKRFKHIFKEKKITHNVELNCGSISFGKVVYKDDEKIPVSTKKSYQVLNIGEFLINPLNLNYDLKSLRIGLSDKDVVVSSGYIIVQNTAEISKDYYKWLLHIFDVAFMKTLGSGVRQTLSFTHIANSELVFPPLQEQTKIAQFLDDKTSKIDAAIGIKEQQIRLLKERKQILIHKAVTRGLDDSVTLKDSGVEWIGEIPEHWAIIKLKQGCLKITDGAHISPEIGEDIKPFVSTVNIDDYGSIDLENCIYTTMKCYNYLVKTGCKPALNDVLFSKDGTVGRTAVIDRELDFVVASSLVIISPNLNIFNPCFLNLLLSSSHIKMQTDGILSGSALKRISIVKVSNLLLFKIPLSEQKEISAYIETASQKIETAIALKQQEIEKLKEYKHSLINGVVTGKVRVC